MGSPVYVHCILAIQPSLNASLRHHLYNLSFLNVKVTKPQEPSRICNIPFTRNIPLVRYTLYVRRWDNMFFFEKTICCGAIKAHCQSNSAQKDNYVTSAHVSQAYTTWGGPWALSNGGQSHVTAQSRTNPPKQWSCMERKGANTNAHTRTHTDACARAKWNAGNKVTMWRCRLKAVPIWGGCWWVVCEANQPPFSHAKLQPPWGETCHCTPFKWEPTAYISGIMALIISFSFFYLYHLQFSFEIQFTFFN